MEEERVKAKRERERERETYKQLAYFIIGLLKGDNVTYERTIYTLISRKKKKKKKKKTYFKIHLF